METISTIFQCSKYASYTYGVYKSFSFNHPKEIENPIGPGTYVSRHMKDNHVSYRVYHCRKINGREVWYKLPSIRVTDGVINADKSTVDALNFVSYLLPDELAKLLNELNKFISI